MKVPIYTANLIIEIYDRQTMGKAYSRKVEESVTVVKGYNINQIKKRMTEALRFKILGTKTERKNYDIRVLNVHLLRQHGFGIKDF